MEVEVVGTQVAGTGWIRMVSGIAALVVKVKELFDLDEVEMPHGVILREEQEPVRKVTLHDDVRVDGEVKKKMASDVLHL